ncbi:hypothetical protein LJR235_003559 [Pararhizobium sp. LjRoot235]|uniref:hypothetical protein n=1 Tax=Pararhizobium sp. LjRoot235 TaxID=3342291 RepID=UPI003ECF8DF1
MAFNGEKFGKEVVEIVKDYLRRQIEPLEERITFLEAQAGIAKASKTVVRIVAPTRQARP